MFCGGCKSNFDQRVVEKDCCGEEERITVGEVYIVLDARTH